MVTPAITRRNLLGGAMALGLAATPPVRAGAAETARPVAKRIRVIVDNDFGGDPDGLFQLAHFVLSPSVALPLVIGTQYRDFGAADRVPNKGQASAAKARELLSYFPAAARPPVIAGADRPLSSHIAGPVSAASTAIITEALRTDCETPLIYAAGGSLTDLALAWLAEPRIGSRLKLIWIGGAEHPDLATAPAGRAEPEYNFSLDRLAAQIVFNESDIEVWQVPRNAFRQMMIGTAELDLIGRTHLGRYLRSQVVTTEERLAQNLPGFVFSRGETYTLGDTALVTLAALQSAFQPDTPSSRYDVRPTPVLNEDGTYRPNPSGRPMRVYSAIDANLTWRDFTAKLARR